MYGTDHLNSVNLMGNIKFTFKEEDLWKITFPDMLIVCKEDESLMLLVYWKKTHAD